MTREEAIARVKHQRDWANEVNRTLDVEAFDMATKALEQEPRKGHWITKPHVYGVAFCSECDFELKTNDTNFCPNCGADMKEGEE